MKVALSVVADPVPTNEAHAIIPENISTGLGRAICAALTNHEPPEGFNPEQIERIG